MSGRIEHENRTNNNIENILKTSHPLLKKYYLKIRTTKEPLTCLEYVRKINAFLETTNKNINNITIKDIDDYMNMIFYITDSKGKQRRSSSSYRQSVYAALNSFFGYLYSRGEIQINPMIEIDRPKSTDHVIRKALDLEDFNNILKTIKIGAGSDMAKLKQKRWVERDLLIMYLFMNTGMRKTALSEINIEDIDFESKILTVIDKRNKKLEYNITDDLEKLLYAWLDKREEILKGKKQNALFISEKMNRISERAIYNLVQKYSKEALGYTISPHKLRASFVTIFYQASGCDIKATSEAVGHSNIATTSLYIVNKNNSRKNAANYMSSNLTI
jgi:site-specific recombinase XerC